eukprot:1161319-Pelagomonas_calceolata.AAC.9
MLQKSLQQEVEGLMKACGLMLEADVTRSPSTAETLLAEAAAAEAGTAGPVSLGQVGLAQRLGCWKISLGVFPPSLHRIALTHTVPLAHAAQHMCCSPHALPSAHV